VSVRIRMKKMGPRISPFSGSVRSTSGSPRHGRELELLGTYDPRVKDTDARALLVADRVDYWLGVGAQPSERVAVLIKKYGTNGTHAAHKRRAGKAGPTEDRARCGAPASLPKPKKKGH